MTCSHLCVALALLPLGGVAGFPRFAPALSPPRVRPPPPPAAGGRGFPRVPPGGPPAPGGGDPPLRSARPDSPEAPRLDRAEGGEDPPPGVGLADGGRLRADPGRPV